MKDIRVMDNGNWIDLSDLPRWESGRYKGKINWKESVGYKCKFKYDDIEGEIEIVDYTSKGQKITIKYLDYDLFEIAIGHFKNCRFGKLLKKITNEFKVEIGQTFKDNKRDLIIVDREYRKDKNGQKWKYYKYNCIKCGNEDWIKESDLLTYKGCNVCCNPPRKIVLGINTIWDRAKWMCDYFGVSEEDAKKYTPNHGKKIIVKCPDCGKEKEIAPNTIYKTKSIGCTCGDNISYPEKFIISLLDQLSVSYIKEYSPEWAKSKRYDFYFELDDKKYIIETHGEQHYNDRFYSTSEEQKQNDQYKRELALNNKIDYYIELDCRKSNIDWIKNSIFNSTLNKIFNLNNIDWLQCEEVALSNKIKKVCDYWKLHNEINNEELTTTDLSKIFNLNKTTILYYLTRGAKLKWCNYNPKEEIHKRSFKNGEKSGKQIKIFKDGQILGVFSSCLKLAKQSEKLFGVKMTQSGISKAIIKKQKTYKGFTFKYIEDEE